MRIKRHDRAYIVVLEDGSEWRILACGPRDNLALAAFYGP